jgi:hypothetical protein
MPDPSVLWAVFMIASGFVSAVCAASAARSSALPRSILKRWKEMVSTVETCAIDVERFRAEAREVIDDAQELYERSLKHRRRAAADKSTAVRTAEGGGNAGALTDDDLRRRVEQAIAQGR